MAPSRRDSTLGPVGSENDKQAKIGPLANNNNFSSEVKFVVFIFNISLFKLWFLETNVLSRINFGGILIILKCVNRALHLFTVSADAISKVHFHNDNLPALSNGKYSTIGLGVRGRLIVTPRSYKPKCLGFDL